LFFGKEINSFISTPFRRPRLLQSLLRNGVDEASRRDGSQKAETEYDKYIFCKILPFNSIRKHLTFSDAQK